MFELRSVNRTLQQKALNMGEDGILDGVQAQPLSLLSEIQQSQVSQTLPHTHNPPPSPRPHTYTHQTHLERCLYPIFSASNQAKEALLAHSSVLQAKDEEIQLLKEEVRLLFCPKTSRILSVHSRIYFPSRLFMVLDSVNVEFL